MDKDEIILTRLNELEKELKEKTTLISDLESRLEDYANRFSVYTKEQACLLFKIQKVKQTLNDMNLKKSGRNNFNKYSYYELEDINKPIADTLIGEGLASLFSFKDDMAYLQIVDSETGAWIQWQTPLKKSERYMKQFSSFDKKGDVGDLMKDEQALQTYARRALYLQALEISEPNLIEADKPSKSMQPSIELPENVVFEQIKSDFKKAGVEISYTTVKNKLASMKKNGKINDDTYNDCIKQLK